MTVPRLFGYSLLILTGVGVGILFYKAYLLEPCSDPSEVVITSVEEQEVVIPDTASVQELSSALESVCKLIHTEKTYSLVVRYKVPYTVLGNEVSSFNSHVVVHAKAKVGIGIDYSKVKLDINEHNKTISVLDMPTSEIMYSDIEYEFSGTDNVFNRIGISNFSGISASAQRQVREYISRDATLVVFQNNAENRILSDLMLIARLGNWQFVNSNLTNNDEYPG